MKLEHGGDRPLSQLTISRRQILVVGAAAVGGALLAPAGAAGSERLAAKSAFAEPYVAYHGVDGNTHQQRFNQLVGQGYRMISLSVYDTRPLYAAVWVQRGGPAWAALHGLGAADYQNRFNTLTSQGYVPVLVSATGSANNPVFAAVFEQNGAPVWQARHGLTDSDLNDVNQWARDNNCIPRTVAVYGSGPNDRRYAGVWLPNPTATRWQSRPVGDGNQYQDGFNAFTQVPMRPAFLDANDGLQYAAVFTDDLVGSWVARHGMTSDDYQSEFNTQTAAGRIPIYVQGGGTGSGVRYAALFAAQDQPIARQWTQTTAAGANANGVHSVIQSYMQRYGIRAGTLSVRKNGVTKLSAGYTWAEPGYPITQTTSLFRLASVSKSFTAAAIRALVTDRMLTTNTAVFPLLGISTVALPGQTKDPNIDNVTVQHCIDHTGGWDRSIAPDPVFQLRDFARKLGLSSHVTKRDIARYMYGEPLQHVPGTMGVYSNFGYVLLALVVEKVSGMTFQNYLKQRVLSRLGVANQVWTGATLRSGLRTGEVSYDAPDIGSSAWDPWSDASVPACYGNFLIAEMDGGGGLVATASAVTALINRNAAVGSGPRTVGAKNGIMAGTMSWAVSRSDGIDWGVIMNAADFAALGPMEADLDAAIGAAGF